MKKIFYLILSLVVLYSCKTPYNADIETSLKVLVVEGLVTDSVGLSYVKLTTAIPYDSTGSGTPQLNATVYVTDNSNNIYYFDNKGSGYYRPRKTDFVGTPGNTYILTVVTENGIKYVSSSQNLLSNILPYNYSGQFGTVDELFYDAYGKAELVTKKIFNVLIDTKTTDNTTPRFRYTTLQYIEYVISKEFNMTSMTFYCWYTTVNTNGLNFTNEKYPTSATEITDYPVEWFYKNSTISVPDMDPLTEDYTDSLIDVTISTRILRVKQFRINDDTYQYYKGIASQSADEGKIFDPIATQLYGNMTCETDPNKLVLGFFETSSVTTYSFSIGGSSYKVKQIPNVMPPTSKGFKVDTIPDFWVN